jgi:hypothetical protein
VDETKEDECEQHQELADYLDAAREHLRVIAGTGPSTPGFSFDDEFDALAAQLSLASIKVEILEILLPGYIDVLAMSEGLSDLTLAVVALDVLRRADAANADLIIRTRDRVAPLF